MDLKKSSSIKEVLEVGAIPAGKIAQFKQILDSVGTDNNESTK